MVKRFADRVAIVTGTSSLIGIGAAVARHFAAEGAAVVLVAHGVAGLESVAKEIERRGGRVLALPADLRDATACKQVIARTTEVFGGIDILVNNAAVNIRGPVETRDARELAQIIQVNLIAPIILSRLVIPHLRARGGGTIIQIASIAGQIPLPGEATYSASKSGLRAFSFALREELEGSGVRVCVVSPGPVDTAFIRGDLDAVPNVVLANPISSPDQIAESVVRCALDGRRERTIPLRTGIMARLGAALPPLRRLLIPLIERRGAAAKEVYRRRVHR
jgi:short-subunit dehydrogenase